LSLRDATRRLPGGGTLISLAPPTKVHAGTESICRAILFTPRFWPDDFFSVFEKRAPAKDADAKENQKYFSF
jgi:hypothetical protein